MTPEQRADEVMASAKEWMCDCPHVGQADCDWCVMRARLTNAIRQAVAERTEACAKVADAAENTAPEHIAADICAIP